VKFLRLRFLLVLFFFGRTLWAQTLYFETLTTRSGLSSNSITCVYEDSDHFLWVGTTDGLNRFDGRTFRIFRNNPDDANSLSGNHIVSIIEDEQGIFWMATKDGGLTRYDQDAAEENQFMQFRNNPKDSTSIATNRLLCVYDWDENYLLVGSEVFAGIFLDKKKFTFSYWNFSADKFHPSAAVTTHKQKVQGEWIHYVTSPDDQKVYVSMLHNALLFRADKKTGEMEMLHQGAEDVLSINHFFLDGNKIWMSTWLPGLFVQNDTFQFPAEKFSPIDDLLSCVADLNDQYMLAGTRASGLCQVNKLTGEFRAYQKNILDPHALPSNKVNCIFIDSRKILWVGTSAGLARYDSNSWLFDEKEFTGAENDCVILNSYRFEDGSIAVNTNKGMFLSDTEQKNFRQIVFNLQGVTLVPDFLWRWEDEKYILGTEIGFYSWEKGSAELNELPVLFISGQDFIAQQVYQVKQIVADTVGGSPGIWVVVIGYGLDYYHFDTDSLDELVNSGQYPQSIGSNLSKRLVVDKNKNVWVATAAGLSKWNRAEKVRNIFDHYLNEPGNKNSLPSNDISDIWCDENNHIWLTMNGGGLAEFDGKNFTQYLPENPVSSRTFMGMHADNRNRIWIITRNGLEVFDRKEKKFFHLDVNDGSINTSINSYFSNKQNGWVSFTGGNRVFSFQPDEMEFGTEYPDLYLSDMSAFGKSFLQEAKSGEVKLKSNQRFVNFEVGALQFTSAQTVHFQYRLDGLGDDWTDSDNGEIKYTNLPWGNFKLLVRVTNPAGQLGDETVLAEFKIATPFYATWWFIMLCILTTAGIIYAIYRYRINQILKLQRVRNKIARDLHDDIGSTLGSISFFSEAAKQQLSQNSSGTEKMLEKIGETSREMIDNMSDIVWSVNPQNDSVKHLIGRMRTFADDLIASSDILLHFNYDPSIEHVKLSMEQRKNIFLIFKETIYNSVKYAGGKNIFIELIQQGKNVILKMRDDGKGFDVNNYVSKNGNGIRNMKHRAKEINAEYKIESSEKGTITSIFI